MTNQPGASQPAPVLAIRGVTISFGGVHAVRNVSMEVQPGQVVALIGPNGAGKTTLLNAVSGFARCRSGSIQFAGVELVKQPAYRRAELGIGRTFQNLQLFSTLSVLENVIIGGHVGQSSGLLASIVHWGFSAQDDRQARVAAFAVLEQVGLIPYANEIASSLPLAGQKLLAVARALAVNPTLLLLDEPAAGMVGEGIDELASLFRHLTEERNLGILLVEHHMELVMKVSDRIVVMHQGTVLTEGDPAGIQAHPEVVAVYLGTGAGEIAGLEEPVNA